MTQKCFHLAVALLMATSSIVAAEEQPPSPLTPEIKANLRSDVVTLMAEAFLTPEGVAKVKSVAYAYVSKSRTEPGCIQYQLQEEATDPGHIIFYEQYASPAAFARHVNSPHSKVWVTMLDSVSTKPIVIHFLNKIEHITDK